MILQILGLGSFPLQRTAEKFGDLFNSNWDELCTQELGLTLEKWVRFGETLRNKKDISGYSHCACSDATLLAPACWNCHFKACFKAATLNANMSCVLSTKGAQEAVQGSAQKGTHCTCSAYVIRDWHEKARQACFAGSSGRTLIALQLLGGIWLGMRLAAALGIAKFR